MTVCACGRPLITHTEVEYRECDECCQRRVTLFEDLMLRWLDIPDEADETT